MANALNLQELTNLIITVSQQSLNLYEAELLICILLDKSYSSVGLQICSQADKNNLNLIIFHVTDEASA